MTLPPSMAAALDALGVREQEPPKPPREKLKTAKFREYKGEF